MTRPTIRPGTGIYGRAEAARLLRVSPSTLRRWVDGYTYWSGNARPAARHSQPSVVKRDLPPIERAVALSFIELMELRVVRALVKAGVSLQAVRVASALAAELFQTNHPLASQRLYSDGSAVFAALENEPVPDPRLVKLTRREKDQIIAGRLFEPFINEIDFDSNTALASKWWPGGRNVPVVLDPQVAFGAPTVAGTGIRTSTLARMAPATSPSRIALAFELPKLKVEAAIAFERHLAA